MTAPLAGRRRGPGNDTLVLIGCWALVTVPLLVALVASHRVHWYPIADLAQSELRVRDVGGADPPLVGLAGRIGPVFDPGSHPGPLSFWLLAPVYRLLGSSAWAFAASAVALHAVAVALVLWMARRRGGTALVVAFTAAVTVLVRFYGAEVFIEPWNPYLPVLWWVVLLVAVWSVLDGDVPMVVPAVVAGSLCAQTHLPYVGLAGGLAVLLAVPLGRAQWRARRGGGATADRSGLARSTRWTIGALVLAAVLWIPPVLDQIWGVGNLTRIKDSMADPAEPVSGLGAGGAELLRNLDPSDLLNGYVIGISSASGVSWWAVALLVVWAGSAVVVWRAGAPAQLVRLHLVLAVALVLALVSATRIYGLFWTYLFLWAWGLTVLLLLATAWSLWELGRGLRPAAAARLTAPRLAAVALAVAVAASASASIANRDALPTHTELSVALGAVARQAQPTLGSGDVVGGGRSGRYLVRWLDRVTIGTQGIGLVDELERQGFTVGVDEPFGVGATRHRVMDRADATAVVQLVTGPDIVTWDADRRARRIAFHDGSSPAERADSDRRVAAVTRSLTDAGRLEQAAAWKNNQFAASLDPTLPAAVQAEMQALLTIPPPLAIYVLAPADAAP